MSKLLYIFPLHHLSPILQPYEFEPVHIKGTVYGCALQWQEEILLRNGSTIPSNYMVTIKRIQPLKRDDAPVEFVSSYINGKPSGAGLHLSIATWAKLYQSLFTFPTYNQHRECAFSLFSLCLSVGCTVKLLR